MIWQSYIGDIEVINPYTWTVQDKINLSERSVTRMWRHIGNVGVFQSCRGKKKIQLPTAPEGIKISGNDDLFFGILGKGM